ncbi:MAG TPA: hypothetical protein VK905_03660, partial [Bacillota bacterium]|nr:hypothetical protein [Bacillota bacterium]
MKELFTTELKYLQAFCLVEEADELLRFSDREIPDMYSHNLTYVKAHVPSSDLPAIISREISLAKRQGKNFLNVQTDIEVDPAALPGLPVAPTACCLYDYYVFDRSDTQGLRNRDNCQVLQLTE